MTAAERRSAWTESLAASPARLDRTAVRGLAVHWLGPAAPAGVYAGDPAAVRRYLRGVRRYHMGKGWSDIAYQWAVDAGTGTRWELRGWRLQSAANGDLQQNQRYGAVVALLGEGQAVTPQLLDGLRDAVSDWRATYPAARQLVGHQDVRPDPTSCPGPQLERLIHGGGIEPQPRPPHREETDVTIPELTAALRDNKHPLSVQLRRHVREAVQAELVQERAGDNPGQ